MLLLAAVLALDSLAVAAGDTSSYWQQRVSYRITASLDEASGVLSGHERVTYVNRSPDTLAAFYVHQYLNAFRPGSRWSAVDQSEGRVRFQRMKDPDYAFERITRSSMMGDPRAPDYPFAPDSTIAHWDLPHPLPPGDSLTLELEWRARPSTLPRRQGRQGRRFDFAQWYPKVVVYDRYGWEAHPLYPAGEFYGEFATYDVTLDLPEDQVIGATGVAVCGDPGWERARATPDLHVDYQRDYYGGGRAADDCPAAAPGRKTVRFRAEQVHHFAFSLNPEYVYEQGRYRDVVVHVLYQPSDRATWGAGLAVRRTETALAWLDSLYGPFAWPQITNVHRIEGGGTEFPMMVMNGGASLGLILHEVGHNYTMGILANNEWREGYLDEGFTSFQTAWYEATHGIADDYAELEAGILLDDVDRWSEPVSTVSERFRDFFLYNEMIYNKGELFFDELRYVVGEETMRRILRTYYARWKLKHVDEDKFRAVCEEVSHQDLKWLFAEWLHATPLIDYRLERVERRRGTDGRWHIAVTVRRLGDGVMPLEIGDQRHLYARTVGQADSERVEFTSDSAPGRLVLDPRVQAHDWNMLNNREPKGIFRSRGSNALRFDNPTRDIARRDRETSAILPVGWSNDQGGFTFGVRLRDNYLGRFDRGLFVVSQETRRVTSHPDGVYFRFADPVSHVIPRTTTAVAAWSVEGRAGVALSWDRSDRRRWVDRADPHSGFDALWMATTNLGYLDRRLWDDAGTFEAGPWKSSTWPVGRGTMSGRIGFHGGIVYRYPGPGIVAEHRYDVEPFLRGTAELATHLPFWLGTTLGLRGFAGGYAAHSPPPAQRRIYVAGADPYATFTNPLLRSSGALFVRPGFFYQEPGDANLRGFAPELGGRWALSGAIEVSRAVFTLPHGPVRGVALHLFGDGGLVDSAAVPNSGKSMTPLWDAGAGAVATARAGDLGWTMRVDLPLLVSRWAYAADARARERRAQFRWLVSLAPSF